jgi:hypothetical protein
MMHDWEAMAKARGLPLGGGALQRVTAALRTLEEVFRPAAANLPPGLDPATGFRADPEGLE